MPKLVKNIITFYHSKPENLEDTKEILYSEPTILNDVMNLLVEFYPSNSALRTRKEFESSLVKGSLNYQLNADEPNTFSISFATEKLFEAEILEALKFLCSTYVSYVVDYEIHLPSIKHNRKYEITYKDFTKQVVNKIIQD